jgi:hypothetical protein
MEIVVSGGNGGGRVTGVDMVYVVLCCVVLCCVLLCCVVFCCVAVWNNMPTLTLLLRATNASSPNHTIPNRTKGIIL